MEGHQFGQLLGAVSTDSRQPFRDRCVCLGPPADRQATIRDVANKRVLEGVLHLAGQTRGGSHGDESPTLELAHPLRHIRGSDRDRDRLFPKDTTDDCGLAQRSALDLRQRIDSSGKKALDRVRNGHPGPVAGQLPTAIFDGKGARFDQPADDLLDEQRVPFGCVENLVLQGFRQVISGQQPGEQVCALRPVERAKRNAHRLAPARAKRCMCLGELGASRSDEQDRAVRAQEETLDHLHDLVARPMQVLDDDHNGAPSGHGRKELGPAPRELGGDRQRPDPVKGIVREVDPSRGRKREDRRLGIGGGNTCRAEHIPDPASELFLCL